MVDHRLVVGHFLEPYGCGLVIVCQANDLVGDDRVGCADLELEGAAVRRESRARRRECSLDLGGNRERRLEASTVPCGCRFGVVVDEQHDAQVGELLEGR